MAWILPPIRIGSTPQLKAIGCAHPPAGVWQGLSPAGGCNAAHDEHDRQRFFSKRFAWKVRAVEWHPFSKLFPMLGETELQVLADDIRENGLKQPIVLDRHDRIIDGRNRAAACAIAGVVPVYEPFVGSDADILKLVVSLNIHRRHLTESQRGMVAAEVANLSNGQHATSSSAGSIEPACEAKVSIDEACELLNVGRETVKRARKVHKDGTQELKDAVVSGEISVSKAAEISALPKEKQRDAIQKPRTEIRKQRRPPKRDDILSSAQALIEAIRDLRAIADGGLMRLSIMKLRDVAKRIDSAARHFVGSYMND